MVWLTGMRTMTTCSYVVFLNRELFYGFEFLRSHFQRFTEMLKMSNLQLLSARVVSLGWHTKFRFCCQCRRVHSNPISDFSHLYHVCHSTPRMPAQIPNMHVMPYFSFTNLPKYNININLIKTEAVHVTFFVRSSRNPWECKSAIWRMKSGELLKPLRHVQNRTLVSLAVNIQYSN